MMKFFVLLFFIFFSFVNAQQRIDFPTENNFGDQVEFVDGVTKIFESNRPVICVVNVIPEMMVEVELKNVEREYEELKRNFPQINIQRINQYGSYTFGKYIVGIDKKNAEYKGVVFWSGVPREKPVFLDDLLLSTEFISEQINQNKISSYVTDELELRDSLKSLLVNHPQKNYSEKLGKLYVNELINNVMINEFLPQIDLYRKNLQSVKIKFDLPIVANNSIDIFYDELGNTTLIELIRDGKKTNVKLEYEDNFLRKMSSNGKVNDFYYNNKNMIIYENSDDAYEIFSLNPNYPSRLESKKFFFEDGKYITYKVDKFFDKNCFRIKYLSDSLEFKKYCISDPNFKNFPIKIDYYNMSHEKRYDLTLTKEKNNYYLKDKSKESWNQDFIYNKNKELEKIFINYKEKNLSYHVLFEYKYYD